LRKHYGLNEELLEQLSSYIYKKYNGLFGAALAIPVHKNTQHSMIVGSDNGMTHKIKSCHPNNNCTRNTNKADKCVQ